MLLLWGSTSRVISCLPMGRGSIHGDMNRSTGDLRCLMCAWTAKHTSPSVFLPKHWYLSHVYPFKHQPLGATVMVTRLRQKVEAQCWLQVKGIYAIQAIFRQRRCC